MQPAGSRHTSHLTDPAAPSSGDRPAIAIVGAGPRGTSIIERIGAQLRDAPVSLDLHVIDDAPSGAGRIWRTDQDRELCMNTLAHAVTLFTEPGSTVAGPIVQGPTLYEWCVLVRNSTLPTTPEAVALVATIPSDHRDTFTSFPVRDRLGIDFRTELETMRPESHPSRALYGEYLIWCYGRAVTALPDEVRVVRHHARATAIERVDGREQISLEFQHNGVADTVTADAVVLATGWMPRRPTTRELALSERVAARPDLTWVRPDSPADQPLDGVRSRRPAIIRGMGMGFFDSVSLLTIGRGGRFVPSDDSRAGLRYVASGEEPILHATSRRGVPFRAKSIYDAMPPRPAQRYLLAGEWQQRPRPINFNQEFWPRVVADAFFDHAETLSRVRPGALAAPPSVVRSTIDHVLATLLNERDDDLEIRALDRAPTRFAAALADVIPDPADRFDLVSDMHPVRETFASPHAFNAWTIERVATDLAEAMLGRDSARKAGLWSISAARGVAAKIGTNGGFDAESRATGFNLLIALGGMVGSGPPAFRIRQLLALAEAGIVRFIGPDARIDVEAAGFVAESDQVTGSCVEAPALIDAWMHAHDVSASADPLTMSLDRAGRVRPFTVAARSGEAARTGAFAIDVETRLLLRRDGSRDPAVHVVGIPVHEQVHGTLISPMPGTDPSMLRETDCVARSVIHIASSAASHSTASSHVVASP